MTLVWNPRDVPAALVIDHLNQAFDGGWSPNTFEWYLQRKHGGRTPDLCLRLDEQQRATAGASLNYRRLRHQDGQIDNVAIISGAWTAPAARGKGHFTELCHQLSRRADAQGASLVLAFVTQDNPSRRALERAGARLVPSSYLTASTDTPHGAVKRIRHVTPAFGTWHANASVQGVGLHYATATEWTEQLFDRPNTVHVLQVGTDRIALVETVGTTERLQWLSGTLDDAANDVISLAAHAARSGRDFFCFTTNTSLAQALSASGFRTRQGAITCLPGPSFQPSLDALLGAQWHIQSGDRM